MRHPELAIGIVVVTCGLGLPPASGQTFSSGSTGADGAFSPTSSVELTLPPTGTYNFTTINIPAGVTVSFKTARGSRSPAVTMLATGNVVVTGTLSLVGQSQGSGGNGGQGTQLSSNAGVGGPGGFDGGTGGTAGTGGSGLGPGGGAGGIPASPPPPATPTIIAVPAGGAGYLSAGAGTRGGTSYGNTALMPLVGGSGGGGGAVPAFGVTGGGGGGGGGALLIASSATITLTGTINAAGGGGGAASFGAAPGAGGSGGSVRLVASAITGSGSINVAGGAGVNAGSAGRIRIEAFTNTATINVSGSASGLSVAQPTSVALSGITLRIASVAGLPAPASPTGSYSTPDLVLPAGSPAPVTVALEATNIPLGTTIVVTATPQTEAAASVVSTPLAGSFAASTATATVPISVTQPTVISASASFTLSAAGGDAPVIADGEPVERVRVGATLGGAASVTYLTASGREVGGEVIR
jgi:hypothetical protein